MAFQLVKLIGSPVNVNTNLNPLGEWDNSTNYVVADVVSYHGSSYICVADNNNTLPTDTAYWMVLAEAGANTVTVRNTTGSTLYKGTVVYINGASGNFPTVAKALATGDPTSAQTLGFVFADISNNSQGEVITEGNLYDLDTRTTATHPFTSDTLANGEQLYLSPDTAGYVTNVKPSAPDHLVYVGTVVNTGTSNGEILVKVMNGYELEELHDVSITSVADNDIIQYDLATDLWKNEVLDKSSVGLGNVTDDAQVKYSAPEIGANLNLSTYALTITATAGENLVAGNLVYLKNDGKYWKASNTSTTTATTKLLIANGTINADATGSFTAYGPFTTTGLTAGSNYFVGASGAITTTAPTTEDYVVRPIGTALSTTILEFNPDNTWITYKA